VVVAVATEISQVLDKLVALAEVVVVRIAERLSMLLVLGHHRRAMLVELVAVVV
jgi:hypothetical protein